MKFLNVTRAARPVPDGALDSRLTAILERGQAELSLYQSHSEVLKPQGIQRRFWTPAELAPADEND